MKNNLKLGGDYKKEPVNKWPEHKDITLKLLLIAFGVSILIFSTGVMFVLKVLVDKGIVK